MISAVPRALKRFMRAMRMWLPPAGVQCRVEVDRERETMLTPL